ncbi:MAG: hypothetical protein IT282_01135 [Bacteroidetes bacterium]|nr:hypothetical protein [Bacteroidota bacterium]
MMSRHQAPKENGTAGRRHGESLSPTRRRVFWIILLSIPLVMLFLLEAGLRLAGYGGNLDLVVRRTVAGKEYHSINRGVAKRYFPGSSIFVPEPRDQTFQLHKGPRTRRIFCLGESTMAGFPYDFHATAPSFMADRLQDMFPGDTIEVINVGLSAVGSFVVLDFVRDLLAYEPDLFVVYLGHNEFYGVYGVGSSLTMPGGSWMTRLTLRLLQFRTFLLARNLYASIRGPEAMPQTQEMTLMEHVVGQTAIPFGSSAYNEARDVYRENLERILHAASDGGVPIMFSALVSNLRTHPPFQPVYSESSSEVIRARHAALLRLADSLMDAGNASSAFERCGTAITLDSAHAGAWFRQATAAYALGWYDAAARSFRRAKDLDALRFRATDDFQEILASACTALGIPLVRTDSVFAAASPHGIIGAELMTEHLHPNLRGYFLMGKAMAGAIQENGLLFPLDRWRNIRVRTDAEYFERSTVSAFDSLCGAIKVNLLMQHWPFRETGAAATYHPPTPEAAVAYAYVRNLRAWSLARYDMASLYERQQRYALARRECLAVAKAVPYSYEPLLRAADYYRMEGNAAGAEEYYRLSYRTEHNPFAPMKLAILLLEQGRNQEAIEEIRMVFELEQRAGARLDASATSTARYLLAVALAKTGQFDPARENIGLALQINPGNQEARDLLNQIEQYQRRMQNRPGVR